MSGTSGEADVTRAVQEAELPDGQVTVLGFMTARPGTEELLLAAVGEVVARTRAEPGCVNYDFHQHVSDPTRFVFYENFADRAAFAHHFEQPHTRAWVELAEANGARFDVQFWRMVTDPDGTA